MSDLRKYLPYALGGVVIIAVLVFLVPRIITVTPTADLAAVRSAVTRLDGKSLASESVPTGGHRTMYTGDGVGVDSAGYAELDMGGCLLGIFRDSQIRIEGLPTQSAQACVCEFSRGTIYNRVKTQTVINAQWAVVTSIATEFLVHLDPQRGLVWVIVLDGAVDVAAAGQSVVVKAGWQTWVPRRGPPAPPVPASRRELGVRFPSIDELTNGILTDETFLTPFEGPGAAFEVEPVRAAKRMDDGHILGSCLFVVAFTNRSSEADRFTWHFGDGETSTLADPVHTYRAPEGTGFMTVRLVAQGPGGVNEEVKVDLIEYQCPE